MARGKKSGRGTPRGGRGGRGGNRVPGNHGISTPPPWQQAHGFTLMEAARETSRHDHKTWDMNSLRTKPVVFVSAGNTEPLKKLEDILHHEDDKPAEGLCRQDEQAPLEQSTVAMREYLCNPTAAQSESATDVEGTQDNRALPEHTTEPFFLDVSRSTQATSAPIHLQDQDKRPTSRQSDSSDEVILFKGRDSRPVIQEQEQCFTSHPRSQITIFQLQTEGRSEMVTPAAESKIETRRLTKTTYKAHRKNRRPPKRSNSDDDALIADYIDNMRENGEEDLILQMVRNQHDLGGSDYTPSEKSDAEVMIEPESSKADVDQSKYSPKKEAESLYESESELDDETLAQLLAGHELGQNPNPFKDGDSEDSDSPDEPQRWVDDIDMMDWNRPSLQRRKGKGAKGRIRLDTSDSELERTLQAAWNNDRFKKAERKRHREEMRALGQLGRATKPEDLRAKYPQGISIDEVAEEMRKFLQGTSENFALPPMDKHARKVIHDLANKFSIKSKSVGNGENRRPTLYRTKRTQQYSAHSFDQALNRITRRYFPRLDGRRGKGTPNTIGSGRANVAAATVQDGEIVGAAAPELGVENRGRAMLEKMGWSQGTALGALDNKGILQPVSHAMKRSKAGLG